MDTSTEYEAQTSEKHQTSTSIHTTLFDLIAAISDEVGPEDDDLITATVVHLLMSGQAKFTDDGSHIEIVMS